MTIVIKSEGKFRAAYQEVAELIGWKEGMAFTVKGLLDFDAKFLEVFKGKIVRADGQYIHAIEFDNEEDATWFTLRYANKNKSPDY